MKDKLIDLFYGDPKDQKLGVNLNTWKDFSDRYYRASEYLFIEMSNDMRSILYRAKLEKEKKPVYRGYVPSMDNVYFVVIGTCIENLIKGIRVFEDPKLTSSGQLLKTIASHDLKNMAKKIAIEFSAEEKELLDFITVNIRWYAKYPLPLQSKQVIKSSTHQIDHVRKVFLAIRQKLISHMVATGALKEIYHDYNFNRSSYR